MKQNLNCKIYHIGGADSTVATIGLSDESQVIAHVPYETPEDRANAEFIVRAVNSHDALLAACQELLAMVDELLPLAPKGCRWGTLATDNARKAITQATGNEIGKE